MAVRNHGLHKLGLIESLKADWIVEQDDGPDDQVVTYIKGAQVPAWILGTERLTLQKQVVVASATHRHGKKSGVMVSTTWTMQIGSDGTDKMLH